MLDSCCLLEHFAGMLQSMLWQNCLPASAHVSREQQHRQHGQHVCLSEQICPPHFCLKPA